MIVNFFWSGDGFSYIHRLCVLSHLQVGHKVHIWLHGDTPNSRYWIDDLDCCVADADNIINISDFMKKGGNFKTASSLWRFTFLYEFGGIYSDLDAIALKPWDVGKYLFVGGEGTETLSTGVIKVPPKEPMFKEILKNLKYEWGNVLVFNKFAKEHGYKRTMANRQFYPFPWQKWDTLLTKMDIPDVYSVHMYHTMLEKRLGVDIDEIEGLIKTIPNLLLGKIERRILNEDIVV